LFYPHQFKPLLKFLDNPRKRLLIGDDVGLGKTIEAGYILRELQAHESVERVLVVVPARLAPKWKRELETRFQEHFDIVKGRDIIRQTERIRSGRELEPFHWIISYESIRSQEVVDALSETEFPIDVLIADEAHRMRNPETLQHAVGSVLCQVSADTVVFLSATPVQNRLEDLWHLLRLLSEDEFGDWFLFVQQMEANRHLLSAQQALTVGDFKVARTSFLKFVATPIGTALRNGQFLSSVEERLTEASLNRRDIVELQADLGRLSPLGHIFCRTRKVDALAEKPDRAASWKRVTLTEQERRVYESVEECCRATWSGVTDSWGFQMSLLMAYRMTASCMPAAMQYFREKLNQSETIWSEEIEQGDIEDSNRPASVWTSEVRTSFLHLVELYKNTVVEDSKFRELIEALEKVWEEDERSGKPRRKVVIFSFFRRTLEYLARTLRTEGIQNRMIHGGVGIDDRESAIDDFLESKDISILLTSEVGGEGIDLQGASVLVNYDLPWNPMVVEQRIGRIDRIGQQAQRLVIVNLVIENSVEEYVLQRLFDKIRIFKDSIGELDEILGEEIEKLTTSALRGELSREEIERVVEQSGNALANRIHNAQQLMGRVDGLLAADQALLDEIGSVVGERQIPAERELLRFINGVLGQKFVGCQLPMNVLEKPVEINLQQLASALQQSQLEIGEEALVFARKVSMGSVHLTLSRQAAYAHPRVELIHISHPLTRFALNEALKSDDIVQCVFSIELSTDLLPFGQYGFVVATVQIRGHRPHTKLVGVMSTKQGEIVSLEPEIINHILVSILDNGKDVDPPSLTGDEKQRLQDGLLTALDQVIFEIENRESKLDRARWEQQVGSRRATLEFLLQRAKDRLNKLIASQAADFAVRMAQARVAKAKRELDAFNLTPAPSSLPSLEHEQIAVGILTVH
jgi:superfamily II DNA or RNA helicase